MAWRLVFTCSSTCFTTAAICSHPCCMPSRIASKKLFLLTSSTCLLAASTFPGKGGGQRVPLSDVVGEHQVSVFKNTLRFACISVQMRAQRCCCGVWHMRVKGDAGILLINFFEMCSSTQAEEPQLLSLFLRRILGAQQGRGERKHGAHFYTDGKLRAFACGCWCVRGVGNLDSKTAGALSLP